MRGVIQRVKSASVFVDGTLISQIGAGLLIYVGIFEEDTEDVLAEFCKKAENLRIFEDDSGKLNLSSKDVGAEILVVPNFTLCAEKSSGLRPSFKRAAAFAKAQVFFESVPRKFESEVKLGVFGADMKVTSTVDGPINLVLDV